MATFYFMPGSSAMAPHAALEEAGVEYDLVPVVRENGNTVSPPNYREISPFGLVPAYVDGDLRLYESAAILLHIGDCHPDSAVLPPAGTSARGEAYRWLVYLPNTLQPTFLTSYSPARTGASDEAAQAAVKAGAEKQLGEIFDWIDGELAAGDYLLGDRFSGADLFLFMLAYWGNDLPRRPQDRSNVGAHYRRLAEHPSVARMLEAEEIEA